MRRDHRPYYIKKAYLKFQKFYVKHFIQPQFKHLGRGFAFMKPWHVEIFGSPVEIGDYATVIAAADRKIRLSVWPEQEGQGRISIGNYCLICPGVRIGSAAGVAIGDNCMIASGAYITDCDWHGVYNRISMGKARPVTIEENVWIGDSAIVCKGVSIGENSVIGAGAVVTGDIPPNAIAAGNPARVVKALDPDEQITKRAQWFADPSLLAAQFDEIDKDKLAGNSLVHWFRHMLFPAPGE